MIHEQDVHAMKEYKFQERDSVDPRVVVMFCRQASNSREELHLDYLPLDTPSK